MNNKGNIKVGLIFIICLAIIVCIISFSYVLDNAFNDKGFVLLSSYDNASFDEELLSFAKENNIDLTIEHADDLEAIDLLEENPNFYNGIWLSNSTWVYMLDGVKILNSKSLEQVTFATFISSNKFIFSPNTAVIDLYVLSLALRILTKASLDLLPYSLLFI